MEDNLIKLKENGYKLTQQRCKILEVLEQHSPLVAEEVFEKVKVHCKVNLSTVYRNLGILLKMGLIRKVNILGQADCFELVKHNCHHHLSCLQCGEKIVFSECAFEQIIHEIEFKTNYRVKQHNLELLGTCPKCSS